MSTLSHIPMKARLWAKCSLIVVGSACVLLAPPRASAEVEQLESRPVEAAPSAESSAPSAEQADPSAASATPSVERYREKVQPLLDTYCLGCHGYGAAEGGRSFDTFESDAAMMADVKLWSAALKNVRAKLMPPAGEPQPSDEERAIIMEWIKDDVFKIDPANPDPGRVTLRRLNRAEYRNTIRDLTGVVFDTTQHFPPDDAGYGFDNIGDVLSVSSLLLEKYLQAADQILAEALPAELTEKPDAPEYRRFFPKGAAPEDGAERDLYAKEVLRDFTTKAYRRPVDEETVDRLFAIASSVYGQEGHSFEYGVSRAMVAVLGSPRFLFRLEEPDPRDADAKYPRIDEYSLASRLSYFLWSTMPDRELMELADKGELRGRLSEQVNRMLADRRSKRLVENFVGQWLRSRDVQNVAIDADSILGIRDLNRENFDRRVEHYRSKESKKRKIRSLERDRDRLKPEADGEEIEPARKAELAERIAAIELEIAKIVAERDAEDKHYDELESATKQRIAELEPLRDAFNGDLRRAMRRETEAVFEYIMREDRSLVELLDADYTFLNEQLAEHYGVPGVEGEELRLVELPEESPRGGVLTQGTLLVVTSNPTRTSPVKRGLHILENLLGAPPPPPPPDIPALEQAASSVDGHAPTNRELLEIHRKDPLCHSCHVRMDPLGLALENFSALGTWREKELDQPIDARGELPTGETFDDIRQLKKALAEGHRSDFYRCITEKLLIYALGRGMEYHDEHTIDEIVERLEQEEGKFSVLLNGIIDSAPFQRQRRVAESSK